MIKKPMGANAVRAQAVRARGVLMVKILNKCFLSVIVYNLFLERWCTVLYTYNISIHWYIGILDEIEIQIFKRYGILIGQKWFYSLLH